MKEKLIEIVSSVLELPEETVSTLNEDTNLMELGLDSLACVEIVVNLEEEFGIEIAEEDLIVENMSSINRIINLINKYQ